MADQFRVTVEAEIASEGGAPEWVHLLPIGETTARDGRKFVLANAEAVIAQFDAGKVDLAIDYEHAADNRVAGDTGPVPAAGWIKELASRSDGLWGRVAWTARAAQMIADKEYRYLSPSMLIETATKHVAKIKGAGLVHRPALHLTALANEEEQDMDQTAFMSKLAALLGLEGEADPQTIFDMLKKKLEGGGGGEPDPAKYVPIEAVQDLLKSRNNGAADMTKQTASIKVEDAVRKGILTPAMREWATALCLQNAESFDAFIGQSAPVFGHLTETFDHMTNDPAPFPNGQGHAECELASTVCEQLGLKQDALN